MHSLNFMSKIMGLTRRSILDIFSFYKTTYLFIWYLGMFLH